MGGLAAIFVTMSVQYSLPNGLLESLCFVESSYRVDAIHRNDGKTDSLGVCQIKLSTAQHLGFRGTAKQLMEPKYNIKYAAKYLHHQLLRYGNVEKAVIAYNMGHAGNFRKTNYSIKVLTHWSLACDY